MRKGNILYNDIYIIYIYIIESYFSFHFMDNENIDYTSKEFTFFMQSSFRMLRFYEFNGQVFTESLLMISFNAELEYVHLHRNF